MGLDMYLVKKKKEEREKDPWDFSEDLIYWRKANQIHKFFCDNGEEIEEQQTYKISKDILEDLLEKCREVLDVAKTEKGSVVVGYSYKNNEKEPMLEEGEIITNSNEVADILPTCSGFFFGSTDYDYWYLQAIKKTKEELENLLDTIDFDTEDIYYLASW